MNVVDLEDPNCVRDPQIKCSFDPELEETKLEMEAFYKEMEKTTITLEKTQGQNTTFAREKICVLHGGSSLKWKSDSSLMNQR